MQPLGVVDVGDEVVDAGPGVVDGLEGSGVELLGLEGLHEALGLGVVEGVARPRHADGDVVVGEALAVGEAGVLHAAVGVMDEAAPGRLARLERLVEGGHGERRAETAAEGPAHGLAREGVEDHREIGEGAGEMHIGDVGDPDLVGPGRRQPAHQVGHDGDSFRLAGRRDEEGLAAQGQQIVLAHKPQDFLGIHGLAPPAQARRHPPVAIVFVLEADHLDGVGKRMVQSAGRGAAEVPVVARTRHAREPAQALRVEDGMGRRHAFDDREDAGRGLPCAGVPSKARKACRKKSSSSCWRPTVRSSSAMRRRHCHRPSRAPASGACAQASAPACGSGLPAPSRRRP